MRGERVRRPGLTGAGIAILVLGLLIGAAGTLETSLLVGRPLAETLSNPIRQAPLNAPVRLTKARYVVFQLTGHTTRDAEGAVSSAPLSITPQTVSVVGPAGRPLAVTGPGLGHEDITRQTDVYTAAAYFTVPEEGLYQVKVRARAPVQVIIAPSLSAGFLRAWPWILAGGLSTLAIVAGIVLLILGRRRRVRVGRGPSAPAGPQGPDGSYPPGWYTDPVAAGRMRYWDGRAWVSDVR